MKKRVFVAIAISQELQNEILEWEKQFMRLPVRWLLGKNLHITIIPPWYIDDVDGIARVLREHGDSVGSFIIKFRKVVYGPDLKRPRLIWAEGAALPEIARLKERLGKALGRPEERHSFFLHLTLARFRSESFSSFPIKQLNETVRWEEAAHSFVLMESHLSQGGAEYEVLEEIYFSIA